MQLEAAAQIKLQKQYLLSFYRNLVHKTPAYKRHCLLSLLPAGKITCRLCPATILLPVFLLNQARAR